MHNQSILFLALVAFAITSLTTSAVIKRDMPLEDLHAPTISSRSLEHPALSQRDQNHMDIPKLFASTMKKDISTGKKSNDASLIHGLLPSTPPPVKPTSQKPIQKVEHGSLLPGLLPIPLPPVAKHKFGNATKKVEYGSLIPALLPVDLGAPKLKERK
ncbi:hypothetical protein NHQ30_009376 [Ciborinia camelliae]|nr:hypothetical protein NHQ30_009376 [Ciborinia camelliae]